MKFILLIWFLLYIDLNAEVVWADKLLGFSSEKSPVQYSASQILGKPSVNTDFGETPCAWLVEKLTAKTEWIKVGFNKKINVKQIAIFENNFPGAISSVFLYDSLDKGYRIYSNLRPGPVRKKGRIFTIDIPETDYRVYALKIEISLANYFEPYQIDAVAISNSDEPVTEYFNIIGDDIFDVPENLGRNINSSFAEIAPIISADGKTLYFTRENHPDNTVKVNDQDIWYSKKDSLGNFGEAINIGPPLNNEFANYVISVTPDNNMLILGASYPDKDGRVNTGITKSINIGNEWSEPIPVIIDDYYNFSRTASFNMAANGRILLLSLDREDTFGGNDIYISFLRKDDKWSEPINLGPDINTAANEASPFLASDNRTLYFATAGRPGYGDYDLFVSRRLDSTWTNWSEPQNLGPNINGPGWDAYYTIDAKAEYSYFVSSDNSIGNTDIFRVKLPTLAKPETVTLLKGLVLNEQTNEPLSADIVYEILSEDEEAGIARSNPETGEFSIVLPNGYIYGFLAEAEGFIAINQNIDLSDKNEYQEIVKNIYLVPIEKGEKIILNNIFFEFGEYQLLSNSYNELNRLVNLLYKNPDLIIQINGHTDNVGNIENNKILSENRAKSVESYLINYGVDPERIKIKAYGMSNPIADNSTEEGRAVNRRVEFEILKK